MAQQKEVDAVVEVIKSIGFIAMAEEFQKEPEKREKIRKVITRIIRNEQGNEKADRFSYLANLVIQEK